MVVTGRLGLGRGVDDGSVGGTGGGGERDRQDGDRYGLNMWSDTVANVILGTEPNDPLVYATLLEIHYLIMSMRWGQGGQLKRDREMSLVSF